MTRPKNRKTKILLSATAIIFMLVGISLLRMSRAASDLVAIEAEAGSLSPTALAIAGTGASGGKAVSFGTATTGGGTGGSGGTSSLYQAACGGKLAITTAGTLKDSEFKELSGIAASRLADSVYWVHNDSGDSARIFSVNGSGGLLGTFNLKDVSAKDWEDIATGPGPAAGQSYIYIADTGDNDLDRSPVQVYRLPEPAADRQGGSTSVTNAEKLNFTYPDKASHNVEAVFVDTTGELYFIDKSDSREAGIFKSAANPAKDSTTVLTKVGTLGYPSGKSFEKITSADISPNGTTIAIRTYEHAYVYDRQTGSPVSSALAGKACRLPDFSEPKGEAIAFKRSGQGLVTTSEGSSQPLHSFDIGR